MMKLVSESYEETAFSGVRIDGEWKIVQITSFLGEYGVVLVKKEYEPTLKTVRIKKNSKFKIGDAVDVLRSPVEPGFYIAIAIKK